MTDAWWTRPPVPLTTPDRPEVAVQPEVTPPDDIPTLVRTQLPTAPPFGRHRRRPRTARRSRTVLVASTTGALVAVIGIGGIARALWPISAPVPMATRAVPVDRASVTATASSTQLADGDTTYTAANTLDGDPTTAWNSNGRRDGKGPGLRLTYTFTKPVDLRDITVRNGYQKVRRQSGKPPLDLYPINARVRQLRVVTDAGSWVWELADTRAPQTFAGAAGRTGSVRLEIMTVHPSKNYPDVAISEVGFTSGLEP